MSPVDGRPQRTPTIIFVAIALLVLAAAAPSVGSFLQDLSPDGQNQILGDFVVWVLVGLAAGGLGIACTVVGAWRPPRTVPTFIAIGLGALWLAAVVTIAVLLFG